MPQDEKAVAIRLIEEVWNEGNLDLIDELIAEDHVDHDPARAGMPGGREGTRTFVEMYRAAFPDLRFEIEDVIGERDLVAIRWRATGTNQGPLLGMPPTEKRVSVTGIAIDRIADGKVAESWANWDALGMLGQLGVSATPSQASD